MEHDALDALIPLPLRFLGAILIFSALAFWDWKKNPQNPTKYKEYAFLVMSAVIAVLFAEIHDAITVRISPEYFSRGKGLGETDLHWNVAALALKASYWVGLVLGLGYLIANNPFRDFPRLNYRQLSKLMGVPIFMALICGPLFGAWYWLTEKQLDPEFALVWGVHNGSYFGAALGALLGIFLILRKRKITLEALKPRAGKKRDDNLLVAVFVVALAYELLGGFLPEDWFFDLVSHFRWARWLAIALLAGVICIRKSSRAGKFWAGILAASICAVLVFDFQLSSFGTPASVDLQVVSFNVLTSNVEKQKSLEWLEKSLSTSSPNLVFLMEVNKEWIKALAPLKKKLPYSFEVPEEHNFGFAVYSDVPLEGVKEVNLDLSGIGAAEGWLSLKGGKVHFFGVHTMPPASSEGYEFRNAYLKNLASRLGKELAPTLIFGDLNATPWSKPITRLLLENPGEMALLSADPKFVKSPTWYGLGSLLAIPIDYILHTKHLAPTAFAVGPDIGSDHRPVTATFRFR